MNRENCCMAKNFAVGEKVWPVAEYEKKPQPEEGSNVCHKIQADGCIHLNVFVTLRASMAGVVSSDSDCHIFLLFALAKSYAAVVVGPLPKI